MNNITYNIEITGIVQGVGFRPFLYNLARNRDLKGVILNRGNAGVSLTLQGNREDLEEFIDNVKKKKPSISYIESITANETEINESYNDLTIGKSEEGRGISLTLPPDIAICDDCLKDMRNPNLDKYYEYPFIACAVCGPRFTTVKDLPYDRERSTIFLSVKKQNQNRVLLSILTFKTEDFTLKHLHVLFAALIINSTIKRESL